MADCHSSVNWRHQRLVCPWVWSSGIGFNVGPSTKCDLLGNIRLEISDMPDRDDCYPIREVTRCVGCADSGLTTVCLAHWLQSILSYRDGMLGQSCIPIRNIEHHNLCV